MPPDDTVTMVASPARRSSGLSHHVSRKGATTAVATVSSPPEGARPVRGEERARGVDQRVQPVVTGGDMRREGTHGVRIDDVELDGLDHRAGCRGRGPRRAVASIRPSSRPTSQSVAPSRASSNAAAWPIPDEAPVTTTTRPGEVRAAGASARAVTARRSRSG